MGCGFVSGVDLLSSLSGCRSQTPSSHAPTIQRLKKLKGSLFRTSHTPCGLRQNVLPDAPPGCLNACCLKSGQESSWTGATT